jgi:hypothetical protein
MLSIKAMTTAKYLKVNMALLVSSNLINIFRTPNKTLWSLYRQQLGTLSRANGSQPAQAV